MASQRVVSSRIVLNRSGVVVAAHFDNGAPDRGIHQPSRQRSRRKRYSRSSSASPSLRRTVCDSDEFTRDISESSRKRLAC